MPFLGDLTDLPVADLLSIFHLRGLSGRLSLQSGRAQAVITFRRGRLIAVTSTRPPRRLGELLVEAGQLTRERRRRALALQSDRLIGQPLGRILVAEGWVTRRRLEQVLTVQAEAILFDALAWSEGSFHFVRGETAPLLLALRDFNIERVILQAVRHGDEVAAAQASISNSNLDYTVLLVDMPIGSRLASRLNRSDYQVLYGLLRGASTLQQIMVVTGLEPAAVLHSAATLATLGVITLQEGRNPRVAVEALAQSETRTWVAPTPAFVH